MVLAANDARNSFMLVFPLKEGLSIIAWIFMLQYIHMAVVMLCGIVLGGVQSNGIAAGVSAVIFLFWAMGVAYFYRALSDFESTGRLAMSSGICYTATIVTIFWLLIEIVCIVVLALTANLVSAP